MRAHGLACVAAVCGLVLAAPLAHGCGGSQDCTEKATCADPGDATAADLSVPDAGGADAPAGHDADAASDGPGPHDAVYDVPFDSFVLPEGGDVVVPDGCTTAGENCTNGIDDNCNGLVDCADPLCQAGYVCDDPVPSGWQGPVELYVGNGSPLPTPPGCATPYANDFVDGNEGLNVPLAQCSCACGSVNGADCNQSIDWFAYSDTQCQSQCGNGQMPPSTANFCSSAGCTAQSFKVTAGPANLATASCQPNATTTLPPVTWQQVLRGCGYSGPADVGGCDAGAHCVARPASPFGGKACIYSATDQACPGGSSYSSKQLVYSSVAEGRGCTQCTCGNPTGVSCALDGGLTMYAFVSNPPCNDAVGTAQPGAGCVPTVGTGSAIEGYVTAAVTGGSCQPAVSDPTGTVTPQGPITVCCQP
jgi:hypothetical protein